MTNETEERDGATALTGAATNTATNTATDAATDAAGVTAEVTPDAAVSTGTGAETATPATPHAPAPAAEEVTATPATLQLPAPTAEAGNTTTTLPSPQDGARLRDSLETIKTAVVWLVVIQILTILSPLLRVSLKWALVVGVGLSVGSFAVAGVAYVKALRAQRGLPE